MESLITAFMIFWVGGGIIAWLILRMTWQKITPPIPIPPGLCGKCGHPIPSAGIVLCPGCGSGRVVPTTHPWGTRAAWTAIGCSLIVIARYTVWFMGRVNVIFQSGPVSARMIGGSLFLILPIFFAFGITISGLRAWPRLFVRVILLQALTALGIAILLNETTLSRFTPILAPITPNGPRSARDGLDEGFFLTYLSLPAGMSLYLLGALLYARWKHRRLFRAHAALIEKTPSQ